MSCLTGTYIPCPTLQDSLNKHFIESDPTSLRELIGAADFILSPPNRNDTLQKQVGGSGKIRTVQLVYTPRFSEDDVATTISRTCSNECEVQEKSQNYEIDVTEGVQEKRSFSTIDLITKCEDDKMFLTRLIQHMIDNNIRKMDREIVRQMILLKGAFATGDTNIAANVKTVQTRKTGSTDLSTNLLEELAFSTKNSAYPGVPIVLGWGELDKYFNVLAAGCCATSGVNFQQLMLNHRHIYVPDYRIVEELGQEGFLTVAPGAVQLLKFNLYKGQDETKSTDSSYLETTIADPATGIEFDLRMKNDCGTWSIFVELAFKVVGMPTDMFPVGDRLRGITFVNEWKIENV